MSMKLCDRHCCTGCGVCKAVCKHDAIYYELDSLGFRYPLIDASKCIECGLCAQKCPSLNPIAIEPQNDCYLAWAKDDTIHYDSASGGISYLLGKHVIENGGFAVGCVWDKDFNAVMVVSDNIQDLKKTVGSKYVQSYIHDDAWAEVKNRIKSGQKGIFIGLPCQVAAMKSYTNNHSNLILCDLLCHGGCSPKCHHDHLEHIRNKRKIKDITNVRFRGGEYNCLYTLWNDNQLIYKDSQYVDAYFYSFMKHGLFHESCYKCLYAKRNRVSDITIADYWGIDPAFVKDKHTLNGTNLVVLHSYKGQAIWNEIKEKMESYKRPYEEAIAGNDTLRAPTDAPPYRDEILRLVSDKGFEYAIKQDKVNRQIIMFSRYRRIKGMIRNCFPDVVVNNLKRIIRRS